ncbi:MAG: hypothetical protein ACUVRS_08795 [Armatimonadota bacterium]
MSLADMAGPTAGSFVVVPGGLGEGTALSCWLFPQPAKTAKQAVKTATNTKRLILTVWFTIAPPCFQELFYILPLNNIIISCFDVKYNFQLSTLESKTGGQRAV